MAATKFSKISCNPVNGEELLQQLFRAEHFFAVTQTPAAESSFLPQPFVEL